MSARKSSLYTLFTLQGVSLLGSRLSGIAIGIWLVKEYGNVTPLLLIPLFQELPALLLGVWLGLAVDRCNRKSLIILADAGQAAGTLLLFIAIADGHIALWQLFAIVTLQGGFAAIQAPAIGAITYRLVNESELDRANGLKELLFPLASVLAPVLAGMLYGPIGLQGIIMIDLITFAAAVAVTLLLPISDQAGKAEEAGHGSNGTGLWTQAFQGFAYVARRRGLLVLIVFMAWWNLLLNGPLELAIPYLLARTGSDRLMSWLLGAMNAGALCGALLVIAGLTFRKRRIPMFAGTLLTAAMFVVFGLSTNEWVLGVSIFLLMVPLPMTGALFSSLIQVTVPGELHGRVFAAIGQLNALSAPLSFIVTGPLVDRWLEPALQGRYGQGAGMAFVLVVTGWLLLAGALSTFLRKSVRTIEE
ncbi:MFS transporter [Paenibacillus thermotolerans]|uniref:MFS transporter n=1 Tax=Paenibacillus thermotolerans TaxID=3027807 RepID=UPI002368BD2D|nr:MULTISPECIES: MFS transporter [unclassified Paenibacillus]